MSSKITLDLDDDGNIVGAEGMHALAVTVQNRVTEESNLQVRIAIDPAGDDALHGGSMTAVFTLIAPEPVEQSDKPLTEQATIGAAYARAMVDAMERAVPAVLGDAFKEAAKEAGDAERAKDPFLAALVAIATVVMIAAHGDREAAKVLADKGLADGKADTAGMSEQEVEQVRESLHTIIDTMPGN